MIQAGEPREEGALESGTRSQESTLAATPGSLSGTYIFFAELCIADFWW
jgi:hypothetical protein